MTTLTRSELFRALGAAVPQATAPKINPAVEAAYELYEDEDYARLTRSPHGRPWHTSFHASAFPGGVDEKRCGRRALYGLMNVPGEKFTPRGRAVMEMGQAAERQIIYRLHRAGITVAGAASLLEDMDGRQLGLEDPEHWLTGSLDAVLDIRATVPHWDRVLPMDVKSKDERGIIKLRVGEKQPDISHVAQIQTYSYLCRRVHGQMGWEAIGLRPSEGGVLYYVSRSSPRDHYEHFVEWDEEYVEAGLERIREWIKLFKEGRLPERPKEWRWTEEPCKWCDFKKLCKQDIKDDIVLLEDSNAVKFAKQKNEEYDPKKIKDGVLDRWKETT